MAPEEQPLLTASSRKGFQSVNVTHVGFKGLVGGASSVGAFAVAPNVAWVVGASELFLGGISGPGVMPVQSVELLAREDPRGREYSLSASTRT